jgi:AcrR family transcriptional regulator
MKKRRGLDPKKQPRQARSRATVDYILQSAAHLLGQSSLQALNTNRIAERAGVAVASIYQYFPNKEAILNALFEMQLSDERAEFTRTRASLEDAPIDEIIRSGVRSTIEVHARKPGLVRSLLEAVAVLGRSDVLAGARRQVTETVRQAMIDREKELRAAGDVDVRAFIVVHAVEGVIHDAAREHPEYLTDPAFADALVDLVDRFLRDR